MIAWGWKTRPFGRDFGIRKATPGHTFSIAGTFIFFTGCSGVDGGVFVDDADLNSCIGEGSGLGEG